MAGAAGEPFELRTASAATGAWHGFERLHDDEPLAQMRARHDAFRRDCAAVQAAADEAARDADRRAVAGVCQLVADAPSVTAGVARHDPGARPRDAAIPAALLYAGLSPADHGPTFAHLLAALALPGAGTAHVARLRSQECGSAAQVLERVAERLGGIRRSAAPLAALADWRAALAAAEAAPEARLPPLVVLFEDADCFSPQVLRDAVSVLAHYHPRLGFVLVLGLASPAAAVQQRLPRELTVLLDMRSFRVNSALRSLNAVLERVAVDAAIHVQLGPRALQYLSDQFLDEHFSVQTLVRHLRFALLEHYSTQRLSFLAGVAGSGDDDEEEAGEEGEDGDGDKSAGLLALVRPPDLQHLGASSADEVLGWCRARRRQHLRWRAALDCVVAVHAVAPGARAPVRRRLYTDLLLPDERAHALRQAGRRIAAMRHADARALVQRWAQAVRMAPQEDPGAGALADRLAELGVLLEADEEPAAKRVRLSADDPASWLAHVLDDARAWLASAVEHAVAGGSAAVPAAAAALWRFDNRKGLRRALGPRPRASLMRALGTPRDYLECGCCPQNGELAPTMHDTCIAYKLYDEYGREISLYDWFSAFVSIFEAAKERAPPQEELQLRFVRATAELQHLGFITTTKASKKNPITKMVYDMSAM